MERRLTLAGAKRLAVAVIGGTAVVLGALLLVLPGPGWLLIFAGLAILGTEFVWARRLLQRARREARRLRERAGRATAGGARRDRR